jgi:hypothetical protein
MFRTSSAWHVYVSGERSLSEFWCCCYGFSCWRTISFPVRWQRCLDLIMERVEKSLSLLEESTTVVTMQHIKPRPHLSKRAIRFMEDWYETHLEHPYPTGSVIDDLANQITLTKIALNVHRFTYYLVYKVHVHRFTYYLVYKVHVHRFTYYLVYRVHVHTFTHII